MTLVFGLEPAKSSMQEGTESVTLDLGLEPALITCSMLVGAETVAGGRGRCDLGPWPRTCTI